MVKTITGQLLARDKKFAIAVSRFNDFITKELVSGCLDMLLRHGAKESQIELIWAPGCFEIPVIASKLAKSKRFDSVICLGAVIRGATPHFEYIAAEAAKGIASISLNTHVPVIFGIITADTVEQAIERAGTKDGNKGAQAALNAIEMVNVIGQL